MRILGLRSESISTRPAYYLVPSNGPPIKIVHTIEQSVFDSLPGEPTVYSTRSELLDALRTLPKGTYAAQYSEELPIISFLDYGTARVLEAMGLRLVSSGGLIQRTVGVLDETGIASHERASVHLHQVVEVVWKRICDSFRDRSPIDEASVQRWIVDELESRGLTADHPPIVGCGPHSGDPHYEPPAEGSAPLTAGEVLQLDLWAKERKPGAIYADISWVGVLAQRPAPDVEQAFATLMGARDRGVELVTERSARSEVITGFEVDAAVREVLIAGGFENAIRHRTGHGIDTEDHGSGVNLDSVEFPDHRSIIEGSCFSIEPGIYLPNWGLRTEINVYIRHGRAVISGAEPQRRLLSFP